MSRFSVAFSEHCAEHSSPGLSDEKAQSTIHCRQMLLFFLVERQRYAALSFSPLSLSFLFLSLLPGDWFRRCFCRSWNATRRRVARRSQPVAIRESVCVAPGDFHEWRTTVAAMKRRKRRFVVVQRATMTIVTLPRCFFRGSRESRDDKRLAKKASRVWTRFVTRTWFVCCSA